MKKSTYFAIIATLSMLIILMIFIGFVRLSVQFDSLEQIPIHTPDLSQVENDTYEGHYELFPLSVKVHVVVVDHRFAEIIVVEHSLFFDEQAEEVIDMMIANQSLDVDINEDYKYSEMILQLAIIHAIEELQIVEMDMT